MNTLFKLIFFQVIISLYLFIPFNSACEGSENYAAREVLVKFKPGTDEAEKNRIRDELAAILIKTLKNIGLEYWRLQGENSTEEALEILNNLPAIEHAEPNYLYAPNAVPNDPGFSKSWFLQNTGQKVKDSSGTPGADISALQAWNMETGNQEILIAVIDSGVAFDHPDLRDNIWNNKDEIPDNGIDDDKNGYIDDVNGWDFVDDDNNPSDYSRDMSGDGHGTHVAGIIAARGNNGIGTTGVMWRARIMPLQIFDIFETTSFLDTIIQNINIISAIEYAVDNGAKIINCSFGGPSDSRFQYDAYNYADQKGVLVVIASGNESNNNDNYPIYPANYNLTNIISVAATDENDKLASYSNYGRNTVDIAAPGGNRSFNIYSTVPPKRETLFYEDFESGDDKWIKEGVHENWSLVYDYEFESNVMRDSAGNYGSNENSYIQTKYPINAENYRGLHIQMLSRFQLEPNFDFLVVEGSQDGINFSTDFPITGFMTGFSSGIERLLSWGTETALGGSFYLRFRLESDNARNFEGVALDDIKITGILWNFTGDEYNYKSGTSMAAPVVSGVAGLVWSHRPDLTHLEVKNAILNSVDLLPSLDGKVLSRGRVNAAKALEAVTETIITKPVEPGNDNDNYDDGGGGGGCFIKSMSD